MRSFTIYFQSSSFGISFLEKNDDFGLVSGVSEFWNGSKVVYKFPGMLANGKQYPFGKDMFLLNYMKQIRVAQTCMVVKKKVHENNGLKFSEKRLYAEATICRY